MTAIRDALRAIIDTLDAEEMGEGPPASEHVAHWQKLHDDGTAALAALDAETEVNAEEIKGRAASVLCEAGALCGWPAPNCNAREGAEALFKAGLLALVTPEARS